MKRIIIFLIVLFSVSIYPQTINLKIIETSDVHGAIYPIDFTTGQNASGSLSQVYAYLKTERAKSNQKVILLDNGDILQGSPSVYYYNYENTDAPHLYSRVMNFMKYDAATIGNHDIETGHVVFDRFRKELSFPWLAANAIDTTNNKTYFEPYTIIERQGIKIAVFGLITPGIPNWIPYNLWHGIDFEDMIKTAQKWIPLILEKEKPDLMIGLFHSGIDYTYNGMNENSPRNENASKLIVQQVPGIDIIFVGHDHDTWNNFETCYDGNKVLILGTSSGARNITSANITMSYDSSTKKWNKTITGEIIDIKNIEPDSSFLSEFNNEFGEVNDYVNQTIGNLDADINSRYSLFGDASSTDLIHKIQLDLTNADLSFAAPLSLQTVLKKGKIFVKDMFNLYRYENFLYTIEMTGKEIDDYLEYSYSLWFSQMKTADDNLLLFKRDEFEQIIISEHYHTPELKNLYYNFDNAEGINYTVDVSKPAGDRVIIFSFTSGKEFKMDENYKVAVNSYRGNGGGGHLTTGAGIAKNELSKRIIFSTDKDLRFYLIKWIKKTGKIKSSTNNNWHVIPEEWYNKAKEKDFRLLYGKEN